MVCPEHIDPPELPVPVEVVSAEGKTVIPGYVDQHVHVIGVLGTDGTGRHPESLLAKVRGLETEGISAYMLTASYEDLRGQSGKSQWSVPEKRLYPPGKRRGYPVFG